MTGCGTLLLRIRIFRTAVAELTEVFGDGQSVEERFENLERHVLKAANGLRAFWNAARRRGAAAIFISSEGLTFSRDAAPARTEPFTTSAVSRARVRKPALSCFWTGDGSAAHSRRGAFMALGFAVSRKNFIFSSFPEMCIFQRGAGASSFLSDGARPLVSRSRLSISAASRLSVKLRTTRSSTMTVSMITP